MCIGFLIDLSFYYERLLEFLAAFHRLELQDLDFLSSNQNRQGGDWHQHGFELES